MKEKISLLISLQECDSQLVQLSAKNIKLPEKMRKMEAEFRLFKDKIAQNTIKYDEMKAKRSGHEANIKKLSDGMLKTRERLLEVKNNKEYQAMLKEIESAEKSRGEIETQIISLMEEMDQLSVLVKQDDETLKQAVSEYEKEKKNVEDDLIAVDSDTLIWQEKKAALQERMPADLLAKYEKVKKRNKGVGVISVWKAVCNGCHMNIPPQLYNELQRSEELLCCPNCNRIMYFKNQDIPA